jgi:hypothetical protein
VTTAGVGGVLLKIVEPKTKKPKIKGSPVARAAFVLWRKLL